MTIPLSEPLPGTSEMCLVIPKGTTIAIPLNVIQTDPDIWGPDADKFQPMRWIKRKTAGTRGGPSNLFLFGRPRSCVGKAFAIAEIKVYSSS